MPIKFRCTKCGKLLGIASRKAGTEVNCPICSQKLVVPSPDTPSDTTKSETTDRPKKKKSTTSASGEKKKRPIDPAAKTAVASTAPKVDTSTESAATETAPDSAVDGPPAPPQIHDSPSEFDLSELVVYDDETIQPGMAATYLSGDQQPEPGQPVPLGMVLFPRRAYYIQAVLVLVLAGVAFLSGYFIGLGNATVDLTARQEEQARQRTMIEGNIYYSQEDGQRIADDGAVVMLIPEIAMTEVLANKIPIDGLRPGDPPPPKEMPSIQALTKAEGLFAQANEDGEFHLVVPDTGVYNLLVISRHTARPGKQNIKETEELSMDRYFRDVENLIGLKKYKWQQIEVMRMMDRVEIEFGKSGK